jgi:predicted DNA-binding protein with PD1-like motif
MTILMRAVGNAGISHHMGTITDHANLHTALAEVAQQHGIHTATFDLLGGLHQVEFTAYDFVNQIRHPPLTLTHPLEIVAGHGTISQLNGQPHVHTHLLVSFRDDTAPHGVAVVGGHAARAIAFAVEFTLTAYHGAPMHRQLHPSTGLMLWDV